MILHPNYNKDNLTSDLAIIIFGRDAILSSKVATICLWNFDNSLDKLVNQLGTVSWCNISIPKYLIFDQVAGWGITDLNRNVDNNILQKAQFPVHSFEVCVRSKPDFFATFLTKNNTFCAGFTNGKWFFFYLIYVTIRCEVLYILIRYESVQWRQWRWHVIWKKWSVVPERSGEHRSTARVRSDPVQSELLHGIHWRVKVFGMDCSKCGRGQRHRAEDTE